MSGTGPVPLLAPDSAHAGFVRPYAPLDNSTALDDDALDDFLQQAIVGITGLPPTLVRPLWQPEPVNLPDFGTDWAAVGVVERQLVDGWSYEAHDPAGDGTDLTKTWEELTLQCSFYGPHAATYDGVLRDGLFLSQNSMRLALTGLGLLDWRDGAVVPVLLKERWTRRVDRRVRFMREISRTYPILTLHSAPFEVAGG